MAKRTVGRVVIPKNVVELLLLAKAIQAKHQEEGAASPLKSSADYNWDELIHSILKCEQSHNAAEEFKRKMEESYRERDLLFTEIIAAVSAARGLLKGVYSKNPKKLGDWGFTVDDTKQNIKPKSGE